MSLLQRVVARLRALPREEEAQIMPLVLFLALAFFMGTVLVMNTGAAVTDRIQTQDAVDAAAASGASAIARGMNYVASNNLTAAKVIAAIVAIESLEPAYVLSQAIILGWMAVADALIAGTFTAPIGIALKAVVTAQKGILQLMHKLMVALNKYLKPALDKLRSPLHYFAKALVLTSPILAQRTALEVFQRNVRVRGKKETELDGFAFLLPAYPAMPVCEGRYLDLKKKTGDYMRKITVAAIPFGAITVTFTGFWGTWPAVAEAKLVLEFTGAEVDPPVDGLTAQQAAFRAAEQELNRLGKQIEKKKNELAGLEGERDLLLEKRAQGKASKGDLERLDELTRLPDGRIPRLNAEIRALEIAKEALEKKLQNQIDNGFTDPQSPPEVETPAGAEGVDKKPHPYLLRPKGYPLSFSYLALGFRERRTPFQQDPIPWRTRTRQKTVDKRMGYEGVGGWQFVFAAAQVYNPRSNDMWTPTWQARLVRVMGDWATKNPLGHLPGTCESATEASPAQELQKQGLKLSDVLMKGVGFVLPHLDSTGAAGGGGGKDPRGVLKKLLDAVFRQVSKH